MVKNAQISTDELIKRCRLLYKRHGIAALSYGNLLKHGIPYWDLYQRGIGQRKLIKLLSLEKEYRHFKQDHFVRRRGDKIMRGWTWQRVIREVAPIFKEMGFVPPGAWFQKNGRSGLVAGVYSLDKTWEDVRREFGSFEHSDFVASRNGMRWLSHPEASVSNFLYARGIEHKRGGKYPADFAKFSGLHYGYYDLSFRARDGRWINVEIWGEKPKGHQQEWYAAKRKIKEAYNRRANNFLGINFRDCFVEDKLATILRPYIGTITPFNFQKPHDRMVHSVHWSNADELIDYCRTIAASRPNGVFPTEEWLRKRSKWTKRSGPAYNTVAVYIKTWLGGIRKLRKILGQEQYSTVSWNRRKVMDEYKNWMDTYGMTPGSLRARYRRKQITLSRSEFLRACNLEAAVLKYFGGATKVRKALDEVDYQ